MDHSLRQIVPACFAEGDRKIADEDGTTLLLTFSEAGRIDGSINSRFWRWEHEGNQIRTYYDNGWGGRINRTGTLKAQKIVGVAVARKGKKWNWHAVPYNAEKTSFPFGISNPKKLINLNQ